MARSPGITRLLVFFLTGAGGATLALALYTWAGTPDPTEQTRSAPEAMTVQEPSPEWTVGQLRPNGLRIKPSGRNDASRVLDPTQFTDRAVRESYAIAREIPAMLNKLYCWCGCENRGVHRSNLGCFEDRMAVTCDVCQGTAQIAYRMMQKGETDAGRIQAVVDREWGPEWAKQERDTNELDG